MTAYEIQRSDGPERGIRVACSDHGESEEFQPGQRRVAFYCSGCNLEIEVEVQDPSDWREWSERC